MSKVAERYAKAFFNLATEAGKIDDLYKDLKSVEEVLTTSKEFNSFISAPFMSAESRNLALKNIFENKVDKLTYDFFLFLESKGRLLILESFCTCYFDLYNKSKNIEFIKVTSSSQMDDSQLNSIKDKMKERTGKNIEAETFVDASLIGGFIVQLGDMIYDSSVKGKLDSLKQKVVNG